MVEPINKTNFQSSISANHIVIVDFYASWCGPCKMMAPILDEIAEEYRNIRFVKIDIDENQEIAINAGVEVVPTFIAFKNGKEIGRTIGYNPKDNFITFINSLES